MTQIGSLPTLFGRFTATMTDHERLGAALHKLSDLCTTLGREQAERDPNIQPVSLFANLHGILQRHFAAEEADGYFGTVTRERPSLLPKVAELRAEHTSMLETLTGLTALAKDESRWPDLVQPTSRLIAQLRAHEQTESVVVHGFFFEDEK